MFHRVPRIDEEQPEPQPQCFNINAEILETAKRVIAINLVTVTLLMAFMPMSIYNIIIAFSSIESSANIRKILGTLQLPFKIMYPILISRKLLKSINPN